MAATTQDRPTLRKYVERIVCDDALVAATTTIPNGAMLGTNANGELINAADVVGVTVQGRAARRMVNATGAAAKVTPRAVGEAGVFKWANAGANGVTAADLGKNVFVVDNQTVGKAAATVNSIVAGTLDSIDPDGGVWVKSPNC
jgi:hypothetical protein